MSASGTLLVGQTVLGEYHLDRLLREDEAMMLFATTSTVDQGTYTVLIAPEVRIETTATAIESAVDRAGRGVIGIKGVISLLRGSILTDQERPCLIVVRRGSIDPNPLPRHLSIPDAVRLLEPLADALASLHELGLVHGALCPLTVSQRDGLLVLDFFGLNAAAEAASGARGARDLIALPYRLPELQGERPSSPGPWTDVASLGLLALHLISDSQGLSPTGAPPSLEALGLTTSPQTRDLFQRTLSASPQQRPLDPRAFLRELLAASKVSTTVDTEISTAATAPSQQETTKEDTASEQISSTKVETTQVELPDTEALQEARQRKFLGALIGIGGLFLLGGIAIAVALENGNLNLPWTPVASASAPEDPLLPPPVIAPPPPEPTAAMPAPRSHGTLTYPADTTALLPVSADSIVWGDRDALATIILFGDLTCPFTARTLADLPALASRFGEELRIVFKFYPIPENPEAAHAALAGAQVWQLGGSTVFWQFLNLASSKKPLDNATLEQLSVDAGLGAGALAAKLSEAAPPILQKDLELGRLLGVRGTPVFFINGRRLDGLQPSSVLIKVIEHELRQGKALLADGKSREEIYSIRVTANVTTVEGERRVR